MVSTKRWMAVLVLAGTACGGGTYEASPEDEGGVIQQADAGALPPEESPLTCAGRAGPLLEVDTSTLDPFVGGSRDVVTVTGRVTALLGLDRVLVNGHVAEIDGDAFSASVPIEGGLTQIPIRAFDDAGHERIADRSLLATRFLPEGELNPDAVAVVLTPPMVTRLVSSLAAEVQQLDVAAAMAAHPEDFDFGEDWDVAVVEASAGAPSLGAAIGEQGDLLLTLSVPDLRVTLSGESLGDAAATFDATVAADAIATARVWVPFTGACAVATDHSAPVVELEHTVIDVDLHTNGHGDPIDDLLAELLMPELIERAVQAQLAVRTGGALAGPWDSLVGLGGEQTIQVGDVPIALAACLTGLGPSDGLLRARVGLSVRGPSGRVGLGAPLTEGELPSPQPGSLWLDANLLAQIGYSAWTAGVYEQPADSIVAVSAAVLAVVAPEVSLCFGDEEPVEVRLAQPLPPVVRAAGPGEDGDLVVEVGDQPLDVSVGGQLIARVEGTVRSTFDALAEGAALETALADVRVDLHLASEPLVDLPDDFVTEVLADALPAWTGSTLGVRALRLPDLLGLDLSVADVQPGPSGRYLRVALDP